MSESDYVVVGGGTAGCVVASRLAERGRTVTLLEAGGPYSRILDVPLLGMWAWTRRPRRFAWDHWTVPQRNLAGRSVWAPSGRLVGGSSAINAMVYCRGDRASYDRWAVPGWSHSDLLPYFRRVEHHEDGASEHHGAGGPVGVSHGRFPHPLGQAFLEGCASLGIPLNPDFNAASGEGAGFYAVSQRDGRRSSTATAYPLATPGLRLVVDAQVSRVVLEAGRARGVEYRHRGRLLRAGAGREVILCAGTMKSPQLLQLSGVGPVEDLRRLGVPIAADLPGVGANLRDHLRVPVVWEVARSRYSTLPALAAAGARYALRRRGLFASNMADVGAIVRSGPDAEVPDVRVVLLWRALAEQSGSCVAFEAGLIDPRSQGRVRLASGDPSEAPQIDPNYLDDPEDRRRMAWGVEVARRIARTPACRTAGVAQERLPGALATAEHIRDQAASSFHPVGTCRMGSDAEAVVDPELRVRGVDALRVVDASVMPTPVSGNSQAAVLAIAERAADLLEPAPKG